MKLRNFLPALLLAISATAFGQTYTYESVKGDPMGVRIYTLNNGLKVYLSRNTEKPRIQTYIAVNTGSRNDPAETTGLAHYLEHLMFKGTTHFGTSDLAAEQPLLDSIEHRFEVYRTIKDPTCRKAYYHQIDSISQLAAKYNIPNEYDKMMAAIGSEGSNAYTSNDQTCYTEDIPSNELENWAKIQSDRFQNMVIRGFHTELEAVYEEYNIHLANDADKEWTALFKKLFPNHPYGTQTTIGTQEHLKNPSITNIKNYFHRYYVPNNVAIVMAGDLDYDKTIATIDKYFGAWKKSDNLSRPEYAPIADLKQHVDTTVVGQEAENIMIGWKFNGAGTLQNDTVQVIADMLSNGKAGLIDTDLEQPMKIMGAGAFTESLSDYMPLIVYAVPKDGQNLDELKALILGEIDKLKKGDFDDSLLKAVVANKRLDFLRGLDKNSNRVETMKDAFITKKPWKQEVESLDRMDGMTKKQIVDFANKHLVDNYVCVYKTQGEDTTIHKIDKPQITPIPTNNDKHSEFLESIVNSKVSPIQPVFLDFSKDLTVEKQNNGKEILYKQNNDNDLFSLYFVYPVGTENSNKLSTAKSYHEYVGTAKKSVNEIKKEFYQLACDYEISVDADQTYISLKGLNKNMPKALALLKDYIWNAKADKDSYQQYVALEKKSREDAKKEQESNFTALSNYARKGEYNPTRNVMSSAELDKADPQALLDLLKQLGNYTLLYYGPSTLKDISSTVSKVNFAGRLSPELAKARPYTTQVTPKNEVYIAPYDAKNIYMMQFHNENREWKPENAPLEALFNEYYGGGMNAIVFQELREARGLAYSAGARYQRPNRKADKEDFYTFIITQNDKMMDCIREFNILLDSIPERHAGFELARQSLTKSLATSRTTKASVLWAYLNAQRLGIDYDLNKTIYDALPNLTLQDILDFGKSNISNKPYRYIILGDEKDLDMKSLEKIGLVKRLTTEDIFGY